ncbi:MULTISPECIES: hypothetical protein [Mangrovibacter]|uniref:hypothetical protein n=1 Tax=Mangrovibacter TaxID=451512 RepID=UPI0011B75EC7|nr:MULTISPECIES: hypothetical protein [Mangrovibacter]
MKVERARRALAGRQFCGLYRKPGILPGGNGIPWGCITEKNQYLVIMPWRFPGRVLVFLSPGGGKAHGYWNT